MSAPICRLSSHHRAIARLLLCLCGLVLTDRVSGQPAELTRVRALLVIDTNTDLSKSVQHDRERMISLLTQNIPQQRLELKVMQGTDVTADKILNYYRSLSTNSSEGLLFFYAGHGAEDPSRGHFLQLQMRSGGDLLRSQLREAMLQQRPGLAVLLTDCCSNRALAKHFRDIALPTRSVAKEIDPVFRNLLFQHRGLVDITACTDNSAWGDDENGGIFTQTFARLTKNKLDQLDTNRDGFVTWREFFPKLQGDTNSTFVSWAKQRRGMGEVIPQSTQRPRAFKLPDDPVEQPANLQYAVVSIRNDSKDPIKYQVRWQGQSNWEDKVMPALGKVFHSFAITPSRSSLPTLEFKVQGEPNETLRSKRFIGSAPSFESGYRYAFERTRKNRELDLTVPDDNQRGTPPPSPGSRR
jgi:hypothetical protein